MAILRSVGQSGWEAVQTDGRTIRYQIIACPEVDSSRELNRIEREVRAEAIRGGYRVVKRK